MPFLNTQTSDLHLTLEGKLQKKVSVYMGNNTAFGKAIFKQV